MTHTPEPQIIVDCKDAAESAGLSYASTDDPGLTRRRAGKGFSYRGPDGRVITDKSVLARICALAIPLAWERVWICADPNGHIQAAG
jgi:DNA topoisomerase I